MTDSPYDSKKLFDLLTEIAIIDQKILKLCWKESNAEKLPIGEIILRKELISESALGVLVADILKISYIRLAELSIPDAVLHIIPEKVARAQSVIAFRTDQKYLYVATNQVHNPSLWDFLHKKTGLDVKLHYAGQHSLEKSFNLYSQNVAKAFSTIIEEYTQEFKKNAATEAPIVQLVDTIIRYADQNAVSDVHIEPLEKDTLIRFRIDGILHDIIRLPFDLNEQIVTRIKVMADLRTDEHQATQDGKVTFIQGENHLDMRVSIVPITRGEKVVLRLLSDAARRFSLLDLGFSPTDLAKVEQAYSLPNGLVLSTGPTGSGKTTTLYAMLKLINTRDVNIMTIEDPVEYQIDTVNQIQVNSRTDLTFAHGLRSIVRQDPDVILVGEIRDEETAGIAVNSAMTGHLVLSSLHTNDAATAFVRLIDMGVEPFLVASTVRVVIGQRLVRKVCPRCRTSKKIAVADLSPHLAQHITDKKNITVYYGKGCEVCRNSGYLGRVGIFEIIVLNEKIKEAIVTKQNSDQITQLAKAAGTTTLAQDGLQKALEGKTTIEEVARVTKTTL